MPARHEQRAIDDLTYIPPPGAPGHRPEAQEAAVLSDYLEQELAPAAATPSAPPADPPHTAGSHAFAAPAAASRPTRVRSAAAARTSRDDSTPVAVPGMEWWKQLVAECGMLIVLGVAPFGFDLAFTVYGLTQTILPPTLWGMIAATAIHVLISLGQRYFLFQRGRVRLVGIALVCLNTVLNVYGIIVVVDAIIPDLLGTLPRNPSRWLPALWGTVWGRPALSELWAFVGSLGATPMLAPGPEGAAPIASGIAGWMFGGATGVRIAWPAWVFTALALTAIAGGVAWQAEVLISTWLRRVRHVWDRRPA